MTLTLEWVNTFQTIVMEYMHFTQKGHKCGRIKRRMRSTKCAPPQIHVLKPNPWSDSIRDEALGTRSGHEGGALMNEITTLLKTVPDVQADFRKGRGTRDQNANIPWIIKKAKNFQKNIYFCFIYYYYAKTFDCVDHNKLWKILKEMEYQTTWPASWETCM